MTKEKLGVIGVEEVAIVKMINVASMRLLFESGMESTIYNAEIIDAFQNEKVVRVISSSQNLGANILAIGYISEDKWYKV